jgi:hypothetical protein
MVISDENLEKLKIIGKQIENFAYLLYYEPHNHNDPLNVRQAMRDTHLANLQKNLQAMGELLQVEPSEDKVLNLQNTLDEVTEKIYTKACWLNSSLQVPRNNNPKKALAATETYYNILLARVRQLQSLLDRANALTANNNQALLPEAAQHHSLGTNMVQQP